MLLVLPAPALLPFVTVFPAAFAYHTYLHRTTMGTFWRPVSIGINDFASVAPALYGHQDLLLHLDGPGRMYGVM